MTDDTAQDWPDPPKGELVKRFIELADEISLQVRPVLLETWSEIELTMHQFRALSILSFGPLRVSDIAAHLGIRLSSATNLADRLEAKKLLRRTPDLDDRRVVWCQLTAQGSEEAASLWKVNRQVLENVAGLLTDEELNKAVHGFEILSSAMRRITQEGI